MTQTLLESIQKAKENRLHHVLRFFKEDHDEQNAIRDVKLNEIFGIFLDMLAQNVDKDIYREYCILIVYYRFMLNNYGWNMEPEEARAQNTGIEGK